MTSYDTAESGKNKQEYTVVIGLPPFEKQAAKHKARKQDSNHAAQRVHSDLSPENMNLR